MERKSTVTTLGNGVVASGYALLLILLLVFSIGCDSSIATSQDFVHEKVCGRCGAPSQFDRGCPARMMEHYPHTDYNTLKKALHDDAERFEHEGASFDAIAAMWGLPVEAVTISSERDADRYGGNLTARQKARLRFQIMYVVHADPYIFLLDDRKRVMHFTSGDFVGEYECSRCGGNFVWRPAR